MNTSAIIGICIGAVLFISFIIFLIKETSQNGMEKRLSKMVNMAVKVQNETINKNEEMLRDTANKTADINKDAVRTIAHSIKEGFSENDTVYCKYCGAEIDRDSKFCKECGKEI